MGYWQETDVITNLPIFEDEEVVILVFKESKEEKLINNLVWLDTMAPFIERDVAFLGEGIYDGQGGIKDSELFTNDTESHLTSLLFKKTSWEMIQSAEMDCAWAIDNIIECYEERLNYQHPFSDDIQRRAFWKMIYFCSHNRICLVNPLAFKGHQSLPNAEWVEAMIELQTEQLNALRQQLQEDC